ncbi:hypothetical protein FC70_GL001124 [Paucilactobacillus oligofermentans DSM 15707 = LMG 22743]|uniref:WxL domain-containing protein n=1 Tax=Paucilactobacillus oligofermentans DSM 15707 = LMG 22743 TaxID=1423778 RepID=A0A0R1RQ55_9LACO|nr:hypothetical protein [Paucilactobacillus oligofermentans]KRL55523.1 hypothetical protein FC70_GL001124 [Paucilactobacillus oligofermentans DSM 15707 = LMG 22743]CUS25489.1 Putative cell surface protein [Paucilactobacillus oligofermentans DSM 15707 = LMG 22743]
MKIKRVVYLGLATLLTLSSFAAPMTVLAAGTDTSSSSSQSSSTGSSSLTSSVPSSSSSSANADSLAASQETAKSVVATQDDTEPPAPTIEGDGVEKADWNGSFFGIGGIGVPIITGFQTQPQSEQYVVANQSDHTGVADLGFKAAFVGSLNPLSWAKVTVTETLWTWIPAESSATGSAHWQRTLKNYTKSNSFYLLGSAHFDNTRTLPIGKYYVQYTGSFPGWIGPDNKISKISKIDIVDAPIKATAITPVVPDVLFAGASYDGTATTTPVNATGVINWTSDLSGVTWDQQTGRSSNFTVDNDKQSTDVNRSTTNPGLPIAFTSTITDLDNSGNATGAQHAGTANSFIGGLAAKVMDADEGGTWSLDSSGLNGLETSLNPDGGDNVSWSYQWQYSTTGGKSGSFKDITSSDDGVSNFKGTTSHASDLASSANTLAFSKTSGFVTNAASATVKGTDYVLREVLTANATDQDTGKVTTIEIDSNAASLTVNPVVGSLSLDSVPDFNFSNITATDIYNGVSGTKSSDKSNLTVTDTRVAANKNWSLSTKMTRMTDDAGNKLANNITISDTSIGDTGLQVTDTDKSVTSTSSATGGTLNKAVSGALYLIADHKMQLTNDDHFSSTITWNLTSTTPTATALK